MAAAETELLFEAGNGRVSARVKLQKSMAFELFWLLELEEGFGMCARSVNE